MVDPHGEVVRERYRLDGERRALEKLFLLMREVTTSNSVGYFLYLDDLVDVLSDHGTVAEVSNVGHVVLHRVNGKGL